ncbi:SNARE associated Golgi protein [Tanacetum coccineum]
MFYSSNIVKPFHLRINLEMNTKGVCISDMIPFYLGRLFKKSSASDDLGINEDKALGHTIVQRYGNLIGFVERFSLGVRNPTAFFAGALGISPECFFAGVCCGGLITLPVQLGIGFLLRERHIFALATVATVVAVWCKLSSSGNLGDANQLERSCFALAFLKTELHKNEEAANAILTSKHSEHELAEHGPQDIYSKVMGNDKNGTKEMYEVGVCPRFLCLGVVTEMYELGATFFS